MLAQITLPAVPLLAYLVLCGVAAGDMFLPILPSGATMITAGVFAASGHLEPVPVFAAGLVGAWGGDLAGYRVGRGLGHVHVRKTGAHAASRHTAGPGAAGGDRIARWERRFSEHGVLVLVMARYLPAGRTAAALGAGRLGINGRHFVLCALAAEALWAGPAMLIGYAGGNLLPGWVVRIALAAVVGGTLVGLVVVAVRRRFRRSAPHPAEDADATAAPADSADRNTTTGS